MSTHTVCLDRASEALLQQLVAETSLSISELLQKGLHALKAQHDPAGTRSAFEIYQQLDLGAGAPATVPATESLRGAQEAIRRKHRR